MCWRPIASRRYSAARLFGLIDRGFIGPGKRADIVLVEDLAACSVTQVFCAGRLVEDGLFADRAAVAPVGLAQRQEPAGSTQPTSGQRRARARRP